MPRFIRCRSGASAVEFALVAPLFLLLVCGILIYGVWFALALSVQSLASESARAALAGMDLDERRALARNYLVEHASSSGLGLANISHSIEVTEAHVLVTVRFDASRHPVMSMRDLIPSPPAQIERFAVVDGA